MGKHIHKQFSAEEVVSIIKRYLNGELTSELAQEFLHIKRRQFFSLLKKYRDNPKAFSLEAPKRSRAPRQLGKEVVKKIEKELEKEKNLIDDKDISIRRYNYSYVKTVLEKKHNINVALSTLIRHAKKKGFTKSKGSRKVMTGKY